MVQKKPMKPWKKKVVSAGVATALAFGAGVATYKVHYDRVFNRVAGERAVAIKSVIPEVQSSAHWGRVSTVMGWRPENPFDLQKIKFVERVSRDIGVSPGRVLWTLKENPSKGPWETRRKKLASDLAEIDKQIKTAKFEGMKKELGYQKIDLVQKIGQADRVIEIFNDFARANDRKLIVAIEIEIQKANAVQIKSLARE